jgi:hypothetical protein
MNNISEGGVGCISASSHESSWGSHEDRVEMLLKYYTHYPTVILSNNTPHRVCRSHCNT